MLTVAYRHGTLSDMSMLKITRNQVREKRLNRYRKFSRPYYRPYDPNKYDSSVRKARLDKYGLTASEFEALLEKQHSQCPICLNGLIASPHIDHDHTTGRVRGLLCPSCNKGLGFLADDVDRLWRAIDYLER